MYFDIIKQYYFFYGVDCDFDVNPNDEPIQTPSNDSRQSWVDKKHHGLPHN